MLKPIPITAYHITNHAQEEMTRRQISETMIAQVLSMPEQSETIRQGREVYQSQIEVGSPPKTYLLRVFVDVDRKPTRSGNGLLYQ